MLHKTKENVNENWGNASSVTSAQICRFLLCFAPPCSCSSPICWPWTWNCSFIEAQFEQAVYSAKFWFFFLSWKKGRNDVDSLNLGFRLITICVWCDGGHDTILWAFFTVQNTKESGGYEKRQKLFILRAFLFVSFFYSLSFPPLPPSSTAPLWLLLLLLLSLLLPFFSVSLFPVLIRKWCRECLYYDYNSYCYI